MTVLQALLLAVLQGVTELFPVSSLGHAVLAPAILHWPINEADPAFLPFLVALHAGTAVALLIYFWRDWLRFAAAIFGHGENTSGERKLFSLLVVGSLPAAGVGFLFERGLRAAFATPTVAAAFLVINGAILLAAERLKHKSGGDRSLQTATFADALLIGFAQAFALIPGISRSGVTIIGGLLRGFDHATAARFSFLLATPVIAGAALFELPKVLRSSPSTLPLELVGAAALVAGVTAYLSTWFLMRYFARHEAGALRPYAAYCMIAGVTSLLWLL
jgi:undecaprenyl-diphosphatase